MLESGLFDTVENGEYSTNLDDFQPLFEYRYLINTHLGPEAFSEAGIRQALLERVVELRSGMGLLLKQTLAADPINGFADYLQAARLAAGPEKHLGVWFSPDRERALLVATIGQEGFDIDKQEDAVGFIRIEFADLATTGDASLEITGPGSFAVSARSGIQQTLRVLSVVAAILIVELLLVVYRSFTLVLLAGVPIVSAILVSIAVTNLAYGFVHGRLFEEQSRSVVGRAAPSVGGGRCHPLCWHRDGRG